MTGHATLVILTLWLGVLGYLYFHQNKTEVCREQVVNGQVYANQCYYKP